MLAGAAAAATVTAATFSAARASSYYISSTLGGFRAFLTKQFVQAFS